MKALIAVALRIVAGAAIAYLSFCIGVWGTLESIRRRYPSAWSALIEARKQKKEKEERTP